MVADALRIGKRARDEARRLLARGNGTRDKAARLLSRARQARDNASDVAAALREVVMVFRAPAIAGGSSPAVRLFMWMAPSAGAACDACGTPIPTGEIAYHVVGDGGETLDHDCYRRRMEPSPSKPVRLPPPAMVVCRYQPPNR